MNIGERIRELRIKKNMSQSDLAEKLGVSRQSISKWETNNSVPEINKLVDMGKLFEVSIDELVCGTECGNLPEEQLAEVNRHTGDSHLSRNRAVGIALLIVASVIFLIFLILTGPLYALIFAFPFLILGVICFFIKKHTGFWCGWALFIQVYTYFRYATGIRFWWAFTPWIYRKGLEIHAIIAWCMTLGLFALVGFTVKFFYKKEENKK